MERAAEQQQLLHYADKGGASSQNGHDEVNEIETHVQEILGKLEQLSLEIQVAVYLRLLNGLASKLTSAVVTKSIAAARVDQAAQAKPKTTATRSGRSDTHWGAAIEN